MLVFNTEEERQRAINDLPEDPPVGVDIFEFQRESEKRLDEIMSAKIGKEEQNLKEEDLDDEHQENYQKLDEVKEPVKKVEKVEKKDDEDSDRNANFLRQQRDELARKAKLLEDQINMLKSATVEKKDTTDHTAYDKQISDVEAEINRLEQEMNKPDIDVYDDEYQKNLRKQNQLSVKLSSLNNQKSKDLWKSQMTELENLKNEQRLRRETHEKELQKVKSVEQIEKFREGIPELSTSISYEQMDEEYTDFALNVASEWLGKTRDQVSVEETELAMQSYLSGAPNLVERIKSKSFKEPKELKKFIAISEINALAKGYVLDKSTGKWTQLKDHSGTPVRFPSHKAAYNYLKQERGDFAKDLVEKQNLSVKSFVDSTNKRVNPVEIDDAHNNGDVSDMSKDRAYDIVMKTSEKDIVLRARENFNDPQVIEYNKALKALDYPEISQSDIF